MRTCPSRTGVAGLCVRAHVCVRMRVRMRVHVHACMRVRMCVYVHVPMCACVCTCLCVHVCVCVCEGARARQTGSVVGLSRGCGLGGLRGAGLDWRQNCSSPFLGGRLTYGVSQDLEFGPSASASREPRRGEVVDGLCLSATYSQR